MRRRYGDLGDEDPLYKWAKFYTRERIWSVQRRSITCGPGSGMSRLAIAGLLFFLRRDEAAKDEITNGG